MRKISAEIENSVVCLTDKSCSSRTISKRLGISQSAVIAAQKRRNVTPKPLVKGRKKLLTDSDARLMMSKMRQKKLLTPKGASMAINKNVSQWTARRALHKIGYVLSFKKTNLHCLTKTLKHV